MGTQEIAQDRGEFCRLRVSGPERTRQGREPGRDSNRSEAKERASKAVGARVLPRRVAYSGSLCAISGGDLSAISSIRAEGRTGLRARDVGAIPARGHA